MVTLIGHIYLNPEFRAKFIQMAEAMLEPSLSEEGCISYQYYFHPRNELHAVFVEEWRSLEDLQAHFELPHFIEFARELPEMLSDQIDMRILDGDPVDIDI